MESALFKALSKPSDDLFLNLSLNISISRSSTASLLNLFTSEEGTNELSTFITHSESSKSVLPSFLSCFNISSFVVGAFFAVSIFSSDSVSALNSLPFTKALTFNTAFSPGIALKLKFLTTNLRINLLMAWIML